METREDLDFMYHGIMPIISFCIEELCTEIVPAGLNSDIIENIFGQQRSGITSIVIFTILVLPVL
jgi:hypothetical protein